MAKFELTDLGMFTRLWSDSDMKYLQTFIDNSALLRTNYNFVYQNFKVNPNIVPHGAAGDLSFTVRQKINEPDGMADIKNALGKNIAIDQKGSQVYSGTLTNFGRALNPITVLDLEQKEKVMAQFGSDSPLVMDYIENIQILKNYADSRLSNMAGQIMSTGKIKAYNDSTNGIIMYPLDAQVPSANKVTAGTKVWSASDCNILDQMSKIETNYRNRTGDLQPMKWQIPLYMWRNVFLTNSKLKEDIIAWRKLNDMTTTDGKTVMEDWVTTFINNIGITSPIEVITEAEVEVGQAPNARKDVQGWANTVAVLRPVGFAGDILHGEILKAKLSSKYSNSVVQKMVAYMNGGIYALINSIKYDDDGYPVLHTDMEGCAVPVLTETPAHVIVDTGTADS